MKFFFANCTILLVLVLVSSCSDSQKYEQTIKVLKIDAEAIECNSIFDVVEKVRIIPLESNDNALISDLFKVLYNDEKFYLLDPFTGKTVLIYNEDGSHFKTIATIGKGPGEFTQPWDIGIDPYNKELVITDAIAKKILRYDLNGDYKNEILLDFMPVSIGFIDATSYAYRTHFERAQIVSTNSAGEDKRLIHENFFEGLNPDFSNFQNYSGDLLYYEVYNDTIYSVRQDTVVPYLYIDFLNNRQKGKTIEEILALPNSERIRMRGFLETRSMINFGFQQHGKQNVFFYNKETAESLLVRSRGRIRYFSRTRYYRRRFKSCSDYHEV